MNSVAGAGIEVHSWYNEVMRYLCDLFLCAHHVEKENETAEFFSFHHGLFVVHIRKGIERMALRQFEVLWPRNRRQTVGAGRRQGTW